MPSSTKWRVYIYEFNGGFVPGIAEIEMHTSVGGSDVCTGGTATASHTFGGYVAANAFDDDDSTFWDANVNTATWVQYEFGSAQDIVEFSITCPPSSNQYDVPASFELQYYDGSDWIATIWRAAEWGWSAGEKRTFSTTSPANSKELWRLYISAVKSGPYAGISEMRMHTGHTTTDACTGGSPAASSPYSPSYLPSNVFSGDWASSGWAGKSNTGVWIGYLFPSAVDIVRFTVQGRFIAYTESPMDFEFQYWDGSAWVTTLSYTGVVWRDAEVKIFPPEAEPLYVVF